MFLIFTRYAIEIELINRFTDNVLTNTVLKKKERQEKFKSNIMNI